MDLFWDSSAVLAMIFDERYTDLAKLAWEESDADMAWRWLKVEARAGMARRARTDSVAAAKLEEVLASIHYLDMEKHEIEELSLLNRDWRLRASDAGHLHCFQQAAFVIPDLQLVCFDEEMAAMARRLNLRIWQPRPAAPAVVRERSATYKSGRKKRPAPR